MSTILQGQAKVFLEQMLHALDVEIMNINHPVIKQLGKDYFIKSLSQTHKLIRDALLYETFLKPTEYSIVVTEIDCRYGLNFSKIELAFTEESDNA